MNFSLHIRTRGEGVKKSENFADIISGSSLGGTEERGFAEIEVAQLSPQENWQR